MKPTSIYLSRLLLDIRSRQVQAELAHPYEMHRTLMKAFPATTRGAEARCEYGVLFRADADFRQQFIKVYVQSLVEPDWSRLHHLGGYFCWAAGPNPHEFKEVTRALRNVQVGQVLSFRLRANPTKRLARDGDPLKGKRVELQTEQEQLQWLMSKGRGGRDGVPGGFELVQMRGVDQEGGDCLVPRVQVRTEGKLTGRKRTSGAGHNTSHLAVLFEGLLRVTSADDLFETVSRGVGSAKAYGFGLMSLAPAGAVGTEGVK